MSNLDFWVDEQSKNMALNFCKRLLPETLDLQRKLEAARSDSIFVDGLIIGTGEEDFTKGNVEYEFTYENHPFNIVDIPGIEGDEGKYESLIEKAIAKAHLIFYVNGTNKKPEVKTAEKIKKYLKRDTTVLAICNIRGKADSYESDEDRIELEKTHGGSDEANSQTEEVLSKILGPEVLLGVESVQGLLGFCAVAYSENAISSISKSRATDLVKAQKNFYRNFCNDKENMKKFSRISKLEDLIIAKNDTFKQDMIESNKKKIIRVINDTISILENNLTIQKEITAKIETEFNECKSDINDKLQRTSDSIEINRKLALISFFMNTKESALQTIEKHFKKKKKIEEELKEIINTQNDIFEKQINKIHEQYIADINSIINNRLDKLVENMNYIILQTAIEKEYINKNLYKSLINNINVNISNLFSNLFKEFKRSLNIKNISSTIVISLINLPLAIKKMAVEFVYKIFKEIFLSKEEKINCAKRALFEKIEEIESDDINKFNRETNDYVNNIKKYYNNHVNETLSAEYQKMLDIQSIIQSQIFSINEINESIRRKPYGSF